MKNIPFWLIEGQTHLGMPRGAQMGLALAEHSMQNNQLEFVGDQLRKKNILLNKKITLMGYGTMAAEK